jgi:hypothetical protein
MASSGCCDLVLPGAIFPPSMVLAQHATIASFNRCEHGPTADQVELEPAANAMNPLTHGGDANTLLAGRQHEGGPPQNREEAAPVRRVFLRNGQDNVRAANVSADTRRLTI